MSEPYTPTTRRVLDTYIWCDMGSTSDEWDADRSAEFDRWLAKVKADARREGQAKAWDEGRQAGVDDMIAAELGSFRRRKPNPYRTTKEN